MSLVLLRTNGIVIDDTISPENQEFIKHRPAVEYVGKVISERIGKDITTKLIILNSGTGSGKSTVLTPYLYQKIFPDTNVVLTQPRRTTVISIANDIKAFNKSLVQGVNIGFQTGTMTDKPVKGLLICTIGVLLQFFKNMNEQRFMNKYKCVIIDEVHLRSLETDSTLYYIKLYLDKYGHTKECPFFILMSGTLNIPLYMNAFNVTKNDIINVKPATSFAITELYPDTSISDIMHSIKVLITELSDKKEGESSLIFVHSQEMVDNVIKFLDEYNSSQTNDNYVYPIAVTGKDTANADYSHPMYQSYTNLTILVNDKKYKVKRKIYVATNSVETGLTLSDLYYVVDTGYVKTVTYDPVLKCTVMLDKNVPQSSAIQRRGRVGRQFPGTFIPMYTKQTFDKFNEFDMPDIITGDVSNFILDIIIRESETKMVRVGREESGLLTSKTTKYKTSLFYDKKFALNNLKLIQYPSIDGLKDAFLKLLYLGMIDSEYNVTNFGYIANLINKLSIENKRLILCGYYYKCNITDLITIAAMLELDFGKSVILDSKRSYVSANPFDTNKTNEMYYSHVFADDIIEMLFIWYKYINMLKNVMIAVSNHESDINPLSESPDKIKVGRYLPVNFITNWCIENNYNIEAFHLVTELRDEIMASMIGNNLNPFKHRNVNIESMLYDDFTLGMREIYKLKSCFSDAYRFNICKLEDNTYKNVYTNEPIEISSKLIKSKPIKVICYTPIVKYKSKQGLHIMTSSQISVLDNFEEKI